MAGTIEKALFAIALFGMMLPQAGWAHGPSRQKITETIEIDAPPAKVWATIADFHDMSWLPAVAKTTGEGGNEPDVAKRQLTLDDGATIDESLYKYDAAEMSYSYRIDNVDVKVLAGQQLFLDHCCPSGRGRQKHRRMARRLLSGLSQQ